MSETYQLTFSRRKGCRLWEIPVGRIHGHRILGFDAATKTNGHAPIQIDDYWTAKRHADALTLNLREAGHERARVFAVWMRKGATP